MLAVRHLPCNQQIDLPFVILVVGKTLVNLRPAQRGEAVRHERLDGLPVLQQTNHVVNRNSSAFHAGIPAPDIRRPGNISVGF